MKTVGILKSLLFSTAISILHKLKNGQKIRPIQASLMLVFCALLLMVSSVYPSKAYALCDEVDGAGAVFYNFERIVVYYNHFTHLDDQYAAGYPDQLKYDKFNELLIDAVRKNFSKCLKNRSSNIVNVTELSDDILDSKNLILIMNVSYRMTEPEEINYGQLSFNFYRLGLSKRDAILPLLNNSGFQVIYPRQGKKSLDAQLDFFFKMIRPVTYKIPPDWESEANSFKDKFSPAEK